MPKNMLQVLKGFKKIIVPELNMGQMKNLLNMRFECGATGYNKVQGVPFKVSELVTVFKNTLEKIK